MKPSGHLSPAASLIGWRRALALVCSLLLIGVAVYGSRFAQTPNSFAAYDQNPNPATATPRAVEAANAFLESLSEKQREKVSYDFASEKKPNWSNLPTSFVPRNGLRLGDLSRDQRARAMKLVASVLSPEGYQKVVDIIEGDQKLADNSGKGGKGPQPKGGPGGRPMFGEDEYYLALFGTASPIKPWMVQFGGHHLGVNVTVIGKNFILTPTHTGSQPAIFQRAGKDVQPLKQETELGFQLVNSLDAKQLTQAVISNRPQGELLLGPGRDGRKIEPKGIKGSDLTAEQQALLLQTISAWINIGEPNAAKNRLDGIKEKIGDTYFAWSGPTKPGSTAYFRIQGPSIVIEYAPQGNMDHIHTVIRNPENDYGAALLK